MDEFVLDDRKAQKIVEHYIEAELKPQLDPIFQYDATCRLMKMKETAVLKDWWYIVEFKSSAYTRRFIISLSFSDFFISAQLEHFELAGRKLYQDWELNYICGKDEDEDEDDEDA